MPAWGGCSRPCWVGYSASCEAPFPQTEQWFLLLSCAVTSQGVAHVWKLCLEQGQQGRDRPSLATHVSYTVPW